MNNFLEQYGKAIFTLVIIAILIAFAHPLGIKIKEYTTAKVNQTNEIADDETYVAKTGRPKPPKIAVNQVYCIYYTDGEMTISQNEIEPETGRSVVSKGFYNYPGACTKEMKTVQFVGAVKPKNCESWFCNCNKLTEIKNMENLYTNECTNMSNMFYNCNLLQEINLKYFETSNVTNMSYMFMYCQELTSLDLSSFDMGNVTSVYNMFMYTSSLKTKSVKVSQATYDKLTGYESQSFITANKLDIV